jgi:hypothetical protein
MGGYYSESRLIELIDEFIDEYIDKDLIPYKKHLCKKLGVTKMTLSRYSKKYPKAFERLTLKTKQMIVMHALQCKLKYDKALFLLIKNYDNKAIGSIVAKNIRHNSRNALLDVLVSYGRTIGLEIEVHEK